MDPKFAGNPYLTGRADLAQMPDTPTRGAHHRRAHSDTSFRFPDLDDILFDDVVADLQLDHYSNELPPMAQLNTAETKPMAHIRSLSMDADFFEGLSLDGTTPEVSRRSMDGYSSATSCEVDSGGKKAMADDQLAELALIDPKRAKRILANRQSAARSKERKTRYTSELERKVQILQTEATQLSAQITILQRDTTGMTSENKELTLKLQAMEQQAHLKDALNVALKDELQWLKIAAAGQVPIASKNSRGSPLQFSGQPANLGYFSNHQHLLRVPGKRTQSPDSFQDFNQ